MLGCSVVIDCVGYPNEDAVHVALKTVRDWLDKLHSQNKVSEPTGHVPNPLVRTPDFSIFCIANVKQLTNFNEYLLYFKNTNS